MKHLTGFLVICFYLFNSLFISEIQAAPKSEYTRTLSFDSGYITNSNRALFNLGKEYADLLSLPADALSALIPSVLTRLLASLGTIGAVYATNLWYPAYITIHEFGHAYRSRAAGRNSFVVYGSSRSDSQYSSPLTLFGSGFSNRGSSAVTFYDGGSIPSSLGNDAFRMTISAGGMNSELGYADYLGERVSHGRAHWFHSMGYLLGKLAYDRYYRTSADSQFSDIRSVTNYYSNRGYGIESSDLRAYSLISLFTSATTWAFAGGLGQFILSGDPVVHPLQIGMFELPQIDFFMYAAGPAFKIAPKLHFGNFSIPISYEQVFRGTSTIEIGIGSEYQFNQSHFLDFGGQILIGRGTGVRTYFEWEPTSFITVAAGADFLSPKLLRAQRLSPELLPTIGKEVFARLGLAF